MDARIETKGNKAYLLGDFDSFLLKELDLVLSFRQVGYEYSPAFKMGRWDGRQRLLSNDLIFSVGLIPRVVEFFAGKGINIPIIDHNRFSAISPIDISEQLCSMQREPKDHQLRALDAILKRKRGIVRAATGSGKTLIAALAIAAIGKNAIVYVIGQDLLWQFHSFFEKVFQTEIGVIGDGVFKICPITIASVWSVGQAFGMKSKKAATDDENDDEKQVSEKYYEQIRNLVSNVDVSILDECHLGAAETLQRIGAAIRSEYTIGMSASPYRDDNADMLIESIFGQVIINISASELIQSKFLVKPYIRFVPVDQVFGLPSNYKGIYKDFVVENDARNQLVVKAGKRLVEQGFVTLILFKELEHGARLHRMIQSDVNCHMLNGKMESSHRKAVIDEVNSGKCKLILASSIFDIGVDIPSLSGLILAGGGKSSIRALQRIGRVIRSYPGKEMAAIVDFYDNAKYLKDHSKARRKIYEQEPGFDVQWPKGVRK